MCSQHHLLTFASCAQYAIASLVATRRYLLPDVLPDYFDGNATTALLALVIAIVVLWGMA